jgi:hypothetical protein
VRVLVLVLVPELVLVLVPVDVRPPRRPRRRDW